MNRVKIGQIGIGHNHGSETMRTLRKLSDHFEVVGVAESDTKWKAERGNYPAYQDLPWMSEKELLDRGDIEAIAVEPDVPDLASIALRCLQAGKHIQMDKPGGETYAEFAAVIKEARKRKLCVHMGYMFRNNPAIQFCIRTVREGWLGEIFEIDAIMGRYANQEYRCWMSKFAGGALYIFGGHLIDLVLQMMGRPNDIFPFLKSTRPGIDTLVDNGMAVLEYQKATAVVRTAVVEVEGFLRRQLVVCGDKGTIEICPIEPFNQPHPVLPKLRMTLLESVGGYKAGCQEVVFPKMHGRYDEQLIEFSNIIRGEVENPYSYDHELLLHECTLRACGYPFGDIQEE